MSYNGHIKAREPLAVLPSSALPQPKTRMKREAAQWRPMTPNEQTLAKALWECCTFVPGTNQKRFARNLASAAATPDPKITNKQREYLHKMVHRYRRQLPTKILMLRLDDAEARP